uniref:Hpt domain-containing protein n=1 Tax=Aquabacterium sp. TaxID=1872578 RepID=UPI0025C38F2B
MDSLHQDASLPSDDLSALAWVHEELRKSLDAAHKALHRCLKEVGSADASDMDVLDPSILRSARQQIHQGVGALEMAGLPAGATLLRASEAVVQKFVNRPQSLSEDAVREVEKASFALLDYMGRRLAGKAVPALALFPQYEALMARAGGALPRPTDLWAQDFPGGSLEAPLAPPEGIAPRAADGATVDDFEKGLLALLRRNQPGDAVVLADLCASLASGASQRAAHRESATWMLASGFLEGVAGAHVPLNVHAKRVLSSLLKQLRELVKGEGVPSDRLANELLFFCAQAGATPQAEQSVLARVRRTFGLEKHQPVDLVASPLGRFDPAWIAQATKRVAGAKDGWSAVAGGELLRLGGLNEQFSLVADSLRRLFPEGPVLAEALAEAVARTVGSAQAPEPSLAMEVATSLLYLDASLEDGDFDHPDQAARVRRLADRIAQVGQGQPAEPLEAWMEDLYRRVSDRQTIGSVVQELRTTLGECEKHIDAFFRDPQDRAPLVNVPKALQSMKGVLAVLGLDKAAHAVVHMREDVDHLLQPDADLDAAAQAGVFDRLASNLGALGFLIDMMGVQPQLAKTLFTLDEATGVLAPVMGREKKGPPSAAEDPVEAVVQHVQQAQREEAVAAAEELGETLARADAPLSDLSERLQKLADTPHVQEQADLAGELAAAQAALDQARAQDDEASLSAAREQVAQLVSDIAQPEPGPEAVPEVVFPPQAPLAPAPVAAPQATGLEEDDEMRDIFLEEAREVLTDAQAAIGELQARPDDVAAITGVRRAFHTLKGSSRMVGLGEFGEAAWACEQLYNAWMATQAPASADLLDLTGELLQHFAAWTEAIATHQDAGFAAAPVVAAADAFRLHGERLSLPGADLAPEAPVLPEVADAPAPSEWADTAPLLSEVFVPEATPPEGLSAFPTVDEPLVLDAGPDALPDTVLSWATDEVVEQALAKLAREAEAEAEAALPPLTEPMLDAVMLDDQPADVDLLAGQTESPPFVDSVTDADRIVLDLSEGDAPQTLSDAVTLDLGALDEGETGAQPAVDLPDLALLPETDADAEPVPLPDLSLHEPTEVHGLDEEAVPTEHGALDEAPAEATGTADVADSAGPADAAERDEQVKVVGPLRISIPLFNIFLNEADEQSRRLCTTLNEWALELHRPVGDDTIALAHSLAGNSAAVGYTELSQLARLLEHALMRSQALGGGEADAATLFNEAADEIRRLLHQFAAGFLKSPDAQLLARLADYDHEASRRLEARSLVGDFNDQPEGQGGPRRHLRLVHSADEPLETTAPVESIGSHTDLDVDLDLSLDDTPDAFDITSPAPLGVPEFKPLAELPDPVEVLRGAPGIQPASLDIDWGHEADIDAVDAIDADLFPIFEEEAQELLPQLATETRHWLAQPEHTEAATACMRTLHTFKGGARLAGAMRLGEMAHRMESAIERLLGNPQRQAEDVAPMEGRVDRLIEVFEQLRQQDAQQQDAQAHTPLPPADLPVSAPLLPPAWQASPAMEDLAAASDEQAEASSLTPPTQLTQPGVALYH